jgi:hypothetical protein
MALTCTIYENNLKSVVMKSNNQKQNNIQHAYITTFCTLPFQKPAVVTCCYMTKTYDT